MNDEETALLVIGGAAAIAVAAIVFSRKPENAIDPTRLDSQDPRRYANGPIINSEKTYIDPETAGIYVIRNGTLPNGTQGDYFQELFYTIGPVVMNQQLVYNKNGNVWYIDTVTTQLVATNWHIVVDYTGKSWYLVDPTTGEKWTKVGDNEMQHIPAPTGNQPGGDMPTGDQPIRRDPIGTPTLLGYPSASR